VRAGVLVVLGEARAGRVEHRVVSDTDRDAAVAGVERLAGRGKTIASLRDELLRARAHAAAFPIRKWTFERTAMNYELIAVDLLNEEGADLPTLA
jgi:hypothetical protein